MFDSCLEYHILIRELVDSLCRDGMDAQANLTTNTRKAYLSTQPSSLSAFMISKTHSYIFTVLWKDVGMDEALYICLHFISFLILFVYFLECHTYISSFFI